MPVVLPTLSGGVMGRVSAINESGQSVGVSDANPAFTLPWHRRLRPDNHAVLWQNNRVYDLGGTPGSKGCWATGISKSGIVVGEYRYGGGVYGEGSRVGFVWDSSHGIRNLNTLIQSPCAWNVEGGLAINDMGQILAYGMPKASQSDGYVRVFLLTPVKTGL